MAVSILSVGIQHKPNPKDDRRNHSHKQQAPHQFPCSKPTSKCKPSNYQLPNKHRPISTSAPTFPPSLAAKTELILNLITGSPSAANQPVAKPWSLRSCDPVGSLEPPVSRHRRPGTPQSGWMPKDAKSAESSAKAAKVQTPCQHGYWSATNSPELRLNRLNQYSEHTQSHDVFSLFWSNLLMWQIQW